MTVLVLARVPTTMKLSIPPAFFFLIVISFRQQGSCGFMTHASSPPNPISAAAAANEEEEIPLLPEADPNANIPRIHLGETIRFEEMGPIILNLDGTTRRIANWDQMTEHEQQVTWRRISKRNEERRQFLLKQQEEQQQVDDSSPKTEKEL